MSECPICNLDNRYELENNILKGKMTKRELAERIGCRIEDVYEHMTKHMVQNKLTDTSSKRDVLTSSIDRLNANLEKINFHDGQSPTATKQLVQLAAEIRKTIMDLNELEGHKKSEQTVTIENYNDFRSVVVTKITQIYPKLCPSCRKLWDKMIDDLDEEPIVEVKS